MCAAHLRRRAHVRATASEGDAWGKPRGPVEEAKQQFLRNTKKLQEHLTQSADKFGSRSASEVLLRSMQYCLFGNWDSERGNLGHVMCSSITDFLLCDPLWPLLLSAGLVLKWHRPLRHVDMFVAGQLKLREN